MAATRITQAKQAAPDLPAIDLALVQDLTSAMYWDIISGALSECALWAARSRKRFHAHTLFVHEPSTTTEPLPTVIGVRSSNASPYYLPPVSPLSAALPDSG